MMPTDNPVLNMLGNRTAHADLRIVRMSSEYKHV